MLTTLRRLTAALRQYLTCAVCGFWYDPDKGHACVPC
ncbi:hypothetical protein EDD99_7148 [Streptomyces sp. 846.5]|nr:hypothetical protein EDD99_7148 [Streptomyces sp. 846.5]